MITYFTEVSDYQSYTNEKADFHFSYNANSGGGQSFLGGQFINENGELTSPTVLDGCVGIINISFKDKDGQKRLIELNDEKGRYEIKPRAVNSTSMKLGVGNKMVSPSKLVSSVFMLPPTCTIKTPTNLNVSILTTNNFWLQSMWLNCNKTNKLDTEVNLVPIDFIYCGGCNKESQGEPRYFQLEAQKRVADIIYLSDNKENISSNLSQCINVFANILLGKTPFDYDACITATAQIMVLLAKDYPDKYSGIEDPLPFLMSLTKASKPLQRVKITQTTAAHSQYLTALRTKPFLLLAGISGTGKSRIVRKLAQATVTEALHRKYNPEYVSDDFSRDRWRLHRPANFELIQVKPNWHNSMDVVGYLSNIPTPHYEFTPFVTFIVRAWQNPEVPFFLCLDEMNLAPVEEYFAEFLSAIESRTFEDGEYKTDPIVKPFDEFGQGLGVSMINKLNNALSTPIDKALESKLRTKGLMLPKNLMVIGTVNMDETTFSFSRKVLDRAMSIEMNEVDYDSFLVGSTDDGLRALTGQIGQENLTRLLIDRHIEASEVVDELGEAAQKVVGYLSRINRLMEGTPFKLGYRAANEAMIYLRASQEFGNDDFAAAMDSFTLMKVLSRIEGDETKLKLSDTDADRQRLSAAGVNADEARRHGTLSLLTALREIINKELGAKVLPAETPEAEGQQKKSTTVPQPRQLQSIKKLDSMIGQLDRDHFVSFWN